MASGAEPGVGKAGPPIFAISDGIVSLSSYTGAVLHKIQWGTFTTSAFSDCVKDLREVVRSVSSPPVLLAMNLGALMALKVCEQTKPSALILVSPSPPGNLTAAQIAATAAPVAQI